MCSICDLGDGWAVSDPDQVSTVSMPDILIEDTQICTDEIINRWHDFG